MSASAVAPELAARALELLTRALCITWKTLARDGVVRRSLSIALEIPIDALAPYLEAPATLDIVQQLRLAGALREMADQLPEPVAVRAVADALQAAGLAAWQEEVEQFTLDRILEGCSSLELVRAIEEYTTRRLGALPPGIVS